MVAPHWPARPGLTSRMRWSGWRWQQTGKAFDVRLATGEVVSAGVVVNAAGPRAAVVADMAGIFLPVEPRKRYTWIFTAEQPLDRPLPLTIDPSGIHLRQYGKTDYMAGSPPHIDPAVAFDDFVEDHDIWQDHVWPLIATRIPQFEAIKVTSSGPVITPITRWIITQFWARTLRSAISSLPTGFQDMGCSNRPRSGVRHFRMDHAWGLAEPGFKLFFL